MTALSAALTSIQGRTLVRVLHARLLHAHVSYLTRAASRRRYDTGARCRAMLGNIRTFIAQRSLPSVDTKARFADLILPYLQDAYNLARTLTGNRADAEDVVQEACLRAYRALDRVTVGNARAWMLTIVHNTAFTWLAKNRPKTIVGVSDLEAVERAHASPDLAPGETPETTLIAKADGARIEAAIAELPPQFRETLVLRDVQGLDYKEIATITGVPIGTVMSRLARARDRLAAVLRRDLT
jgi:RNA polymerase sigma factor (sigma-70 family)